jgi:hypothetical protein
MITDLRSPPSARSYSRGMAAGHHAEANPRAEHRSHHPLTGAAPPWLQPVQGTAATDA